MPTKKVAAKKVLSTVVTAAPKKANAKKMTKKVASKVLVYAADPYSFWTTDGAILNSLTALRNALASMDKEVFSHHVAKNKNDFAEWVGTVLLDEKCAADLRKAKTPRAACTVVEKHLVQYHLQ